MKIYITDNDGTKHLSLINIEMNGTPFELTTIIDESLETVEISAVTEDSNLVEVDVSSFLFKSYDRLTKTLKFIKNTDSENESLFPYEFNYFINDHKYKVINKNNFSQELINYNFAIKEKYVDKDKLNSIIEMSNEYDSIKYINLNEDIIVSNNCPISHDKCKQIEHIIDLSILNELIIIDKTTSMCHILNIPLGTQLSSIGISPDNASLICYDSSKINISNNELLLKVENFKESKIKIKNHYVFANAILFVNTIDYDCLHKFKYEMKNLIDIDLIRSEFKL